MTRSLVRHLCSYWMALPYTQTYFPLENPTNSTLSEYNPVYRTPHFSNTSPMHLQSSSTYSYSDALCIGLCMLCNSAPPPASMPLHVPPPLVCLFVYLCHHVRAHPRPGAYVMSGYLWSSD